MMPSRVAELAAAVLLALSIADAARGQALRVAGDRFTIDGRPTFLVFVSYFDGVRRIPDSLSSTAVLDADFDYLVSRGAAGVRVFPNWQFRSETLMDCAGKLRPLQLRKLTMFVDRAAAKRLVVDVSFTVDVVRNSQGRQCLSAANYKQALGSVTAALRGRTNVLFDLQNEHDKNRPPPDRSHPNGWTTPQWTEYLAAIVRPAVKAQDPSRLLTVSWTSDAPATSVFANIQDGAFDVLAYHHRGGGWDTKTVSYIATFKELFARRGPERPIYFQEPNRFPFDTVVAHYETAVANAKRSGAAAWTFHNSVVDTAKPLNGVAPFEQLLEPGERAFLERLASAVGAAALSR